MKPIKALVACSLLGTLWLASCSSDSKKQVQIPPEGDAGDAGAAPIIGAAGSSQGGAAGAVEVPSAGAAGELAMGGEGGAGGADPVCFSELPDVLQGEGGASSAHNAEYNCPSVLAALAPTYDQANGSVNFDLSPLVGAPASGDYTYFYRYDNADGTTLDCGDNVVQVIAGHAVLPINTAGHAPLQIEVTALRLADQCGFEATLDTTGNSGTCFNLRFGPGETEADPWTVECYEGSCYAATCADYNQ
jgi:hypothetical protein